VFSLSVKGFTVRKLLLASLVLAPALAAASGYSLPNTHPRDLAVCASGVAAQTDAAATFALPAALGRIGGPSVRLGGGAVTVRTTWTDPTPGATVPPIGGAPEPSKVSLSDRWTPFPDVAVSYGGKLAGTDRGWGVGLSLQPFGGSIVKWPGDWAGRYRITEVDRRVFSGILGAGIEVMPQVRIGGGLIYYYTMEKLKQNLWQEAFGGGPIPTATPGYPDATAELKLSGGAFSYDASLEVDPVKGLPLTIAVDYKHKATQDLTGDVSWSNVSPVIGNATPTGPLASLYPLKVATSTGSASQALTIPNTLNVGAAYRPVKPVLVTGTFTFDRWVVYDTDTFVGNTGYTIVVPRHYRNGQTYRAGVAWDVLEMLTLRIGAQRDVSGLRKEYYSPTLPDASSWGGSAGATVKFLKAFSFDIAAFYAKMDKVTVPNPGAEPGPTTGVLPTGTFRGTYEPSAFVMTAALNWQPGAM
jgi:long-chain fatty acid transport protein